MEKQRLSPALKPDNFRIWWLLIGLFLFDCVNGGYKTVCYYESWAIYRRLDAKLGADFTLSPPPCTHLIYAFAIIKNGEISPFDEAVDLDGVGQYGGYQKFNQISRSTKPIKTLLAVGGWNAGSKDFSDVASIPESREIFAQQAVQYLRRHGFQGLDIDWEYPADREGSRPEDKENFSLLLQELREAFDQEALTTKLERLMLTVALSAHPDKLDKSYEMLTISKYVDLINIMTYDYARAGWSAEIKPHNPLYKRPEDTFWTSQLNADWVVQRMIKDGVPAEKLILGVPTYGVTYKVSSASGVPHIHGSHEGAGDAGPITKEKGYLAFHEVCRRVKLEHGWISTMDTSGVPVCYRKNEWISYENPKSARNKALYVMRTGLGGAMVWSLATDDFNGFCYGQKYPITQTLRDTFDASSKMMGRSDEFSSYSYKNSYDGGMSKQQTTSVASQPIPQFCVADASSASSGAASSQCTTNVYCPEITRYFMPYEMSCVQVLGKCSYPKLQICDVPRLVAKGASKFSLLINGESALPSTTTITATIAVVADRCKKRNLVCEGNLLGGYNIISYICPPGSEFDTTLKVCKIPDTISDVEDDFCTREKWTPTTSPTSYIPPVSRYVPPALSYDPPLFQAVRPTPSPVPKLPPASYLYGLKDSQSLGNNVVLRKNSVETFPAVSIEPPQNKLTFPDDKLTNDQSASNTQYFIPDNFELHRPTTLAPYYSLADRVTVTRRPVPELNMTDYSFKIPEPRKEAKKPAGYCSPIGSRVSKSGKSCSSSFFVCLSHSKVMELQCGKGLIFDETLDFCVPPSAARSCQ